MKDTVNDISKNIKNLNDSGKNVIKIPDADYHYLATHYYDAMKSKDRVTNDAYHMRIINIPKSGETKQAGKQFTDPQLSRGLYYPEKTQVYCFIQHKELRDKIIGKYTSYKRKELDRDGNTYYTKESSFESVKEITSSVRGQGTIDKCITGLLIKLNMYVAHVRQGKELDKNALPSDFCVFIKEIPSQDGSENTKNFVKALIEQGKLRMSTYNKSRGYTLMMTDSEGKINLEAGH